MQSSATIEAIAPRDVGGELVSSGVQQTSSNTSSGRRSSFYFENRPSRMSVDLDFDGPVQHTHEYVNKIPLGSVTEEFQSRPVDVKINKEKNEKVKVSKLVAEVKINNIGTLLLPRQVPVRVEPKVIFANERTFLFWMHSSLWLFGASITVLKLSHGQPWKVYYGFFVLIVAVVFVGYAIHKYRRRVIMLRNKDPGPYEDFVGPIVLALLLMFAIVIEFSFRLLQFIR